MAKGKGKCFLCENPAIDTHHLFPVEYGGADDGPKVDLCPNHHDEVHRLANQVWDNKLALTAITPPDKQKMVQAIHTQHLRFVQSGEAPDARRRIVAQLTEEEQQNVRLIRNHYGFKSIEQMLKTMINNEAARIKAGAPPKRG